MNRCRNPPTPNVLQNIYEQALWQEAYFWYIPLSQNLLYIWKINHSLYTVHLYLYLWWAIKCKHWGSEAKNTRLKLNSFLAWREKADVLLSLCHTWYNQQEIPMCCYLLSLSSCIGLQCINRCCASIHIYFQSALAFRIRLTCSGF